MRVLIVTTEYPPHPGGVATVAYEEAHGLAKLGFHVRVETILPGGGVSPGEVEVHYRPAHGGAVWRLLPLTGNIVRAVVGFRPQFIHCPTYRGFGLPLYVVTRLTRTPYSIFLHGTELNTEKKSRVRRAIMRFVLRGAAAVCTNSINTARLAHGLFPSLQRMVPLLPGVHPPADAVLTRSAGEGQNEGTTIVLLAVCRMVFAKGVDTIIEALVDLKSRRPGLQLRLICIGTGPNLQDFQALAQERSVEGVVEFKGALPYQEVQQAYSNADIYVQPSKPAGDFLESFGISFLEAQAAGLPCIGSRWGGVPEAVEEGVTALLVEPGNVAELSRAIEDLSDNRGRRKEMGAAGRKRAARLTWDRHCEQLAGLIREYAGGAGE